MFNNIFPENQVENQGRARHDKGESITWRMRVTCLITKATYTHSEYVLLSAFPKEKLLHGRASVLRYV